MLAVLLQMLPAVSSAIAKAAAAKAAAEAAAAAAQGSSKKEKVKKEKESVVPRELPSRHARSAAAEQIRKTGTAAPKAKEDVAAPAVAFDEDEGSGGWELLMAVDGVIAISDTMSVAQGHCTCTFMNQVWLLPAAAAVDDIRYICHIWLSQQRLTRCGCLRKLQC